LGRTPAALRSTENNNEQLMTRFRFRVLGSLGIAALVATILRLLGLNPIALESVQVEHTSALPLDD